MAVVSGRSGTKQDKEMRKKIIRAFVDRYLYLYYNMLYYDLKILHDQ